MFLTFDLEIDGKDEQNVKNLHKLKETYVFSRLYMVDSLFEGKGGKA